MPRKRSPRRRTFLEIAVQRAGWRHGMLAMMHLMQWWIAAEALGRDTITMDELAEWWGMSRAQAFREQGVFRKALGTVSRDQAVIVAMIRQQVPAAAERVKEAVRVVERIEASERESERTWQLLATELSGVAV